MNDDSIRILRLAGQGFCCSQILMQLALEDMGRDNAGLIRAMGGLCEGMGQGEICGVATGAACVLSLYAGKGTAEEDALPVLPAMLADFWAWFQGRGTTWGGIRCEDITLASGGRNEKTCGNIMLEARTTLLGILDAHGIDPSQDRDDAQKSW